METRSCAVGKGKMENGTDDDDDGLWVGGLEPRACSFFLPSLARLPWGLGGEALGWPWLVTCLGKTDTYTFFFLNRSEGVSSVLIQSVQLT
jgi:hypothetical protein